ncbi:MAG: redoxin domain-containing protein [Candidatus Tectimicrobiota bacterium]
MKTYLRPCRKPTRMPVLLTLLGLLCLARSAPAVDVGASAPDFTLPSTTETTISLSQFKGKKHVLLQFYTMDFNPVCTANLQARMAEQRAFDQLNIQLVAISASNPFSQKMFAASLGLSYPLVSDHPDLRVIQRYGVVQHLGEAQLPVARGAFFLIDQQGIVRGKWINPPGELFPNATLLKAAQNLYTDPDTAISAVGRP